MIRKKTKHLAKHIAGISLFFVITASAVVDSLIEIQDEINASNPQRLTQSINLNIPASTHKENDFLSRVDSLTLLLTKAYKLDPEISGKYAYWIVEDSDVYGIPQEMLSGLIMAESNFKDDVVSRVGAIGPGQIRMSIWGDLCPLANESTRLNVTCASMILSQYYAKRCRKSWDCALKMYNLGPSNYRDLKYRSAGARYLAKINRYIAVLNDHNG